MKIYNDVTELMGKTPLLRLHALNDQAQLFAKCEFMNPMSLKDRLELIVANPDYFHVGQYVNLDNPAAHYKTTGPEFWLDLDGQVDIFVVRLGTGGTVCGTSQYLKEKNPQVQIVAVEPEDAPYISKGEWQPHRGMGLAPGFASTGFLCFLTLPES